MGSACAHAKRVSAKLRRSVSRDAWEERLCANNERFNFRKKYDWLLPTQSPRRERAQRLLSLDVDHATRGLPHPNDSRCCGAVLRATAQPLSGNKSPFSMKERGRAKAAPPANNAQVSPFCVDFCQMCGNVVQHYRSAQPRPPSTPLRTPSTASYLSFRFTAPTRATSTTTTPVPSCYGQWLRRRETPRDKDSLLCPVLPHRFPGIFQAGLRQGIERTPTALTSCPRKL